MTFGEATRRFAPSVLLVSVAIVQIALAVFAALTPWKGGGFGMFSTLDHAAFRGVTVVVEAPDRSETIDIAPSLEEIAERAIAFPSDRFMRRLAEGVAARERRYERPVRTVRIDVWRVEFDPVTLHATQRPLRSLAWGQE